MIRVENVVYGRNYLKKFVPFVAAHCVVVSNGCLFE